jgi:hypothetical protein
VKKAVLCLFVVIALLSAPIAHAAGLLCADGDCAKMTKHENGKASKAETKGDDHCCTHNLSHTPTAEAKAFTASVIAIPAIGEDEKTTTFIAGPPLKPPSQV